MEIKAAPFDEAEVCALERLYGQSSARIREHLLKQKALDPEISPAQMVKQEWNACLPNRTPILSREKEMEGRPPPQDIMRPVPDEVVLEVGSRAVVLRYPAGARTGASLHERLEGSWTLRRREMLSCVCADRIDVRRHEPDEFGNGEAPWSDRKLIKIEGQPPGFSPICLDDRHDPRKTALFAVGNRRGGFMNFGPCGEGHFHGPIAALVVEHNDALSPLSVTVAHELGYQIWFAKAADDDAERGMGRRHRFFTWPSSYRVGFGQATGGDAPREVPDRLFPPLDRAVGECPPNNERNLRSALQLSRSPPSSIILLKAGTDFSSSLKVPKASNLPPSRNAIRSQCRTVWSRWAMTTVVA